MHLLEYTVKIRQFQSQDIDIMATPPPNKPITIASPPFNDPDADLILRTVDNVDFRIHKLLLSLVSPVFKSMFTLPQSQSSIEDDKRTKDGVTIISIAEEGQALAKLLTWCDPRCLPATENLVDIQIALHLADKYGMEVVIRRAKEALGAKATSHSEIEPIRIFAIACAYGYEDIIRDAARDSLRQTPSERTYTPELKKISGAAMYRLDEYRFACIPAAISTTMDLSWCPLRRKKSMFPWGDCACPSAETNGQRLKMWGADYLILATKALSERPCGQAVLDPSLARDAIEKLIARNCKSCLAIAQHDLELFGKALAVEVDRVVDKASSSLKHSGTAF